jgi:uncharacterized repeat protein (TIGR03803 family)
MAQDTYLSTIYDFGSTLSDGTQPHGSLTVVSTASGPVLFGRTYKGGDHHQGTVFQINPDGTGMRILHSFAGGPDDGANPRHDSMLLVGDTLYGMTVAGGVCDLGTIFSMQQDGTNFQVLHHFTGGPTDGSSPHSVLASDGSALYGLTQKGGEHDKGTLFTIQPNGSSFAVCKSFHKEDGEEPHGTPHVVGDLLVGMTRKGGTCGYGVVFAYAPQTGTFSILRTFQCGAGDGATPYHGNLVAVGPSLYGLTYAGGQENGGAGVIFRLRLGLEDQQTTVLHAFDGGSSDGAHPLGTLLVVPGPRAVPGDGWLYGTTDDGGPDDKGSIFSITPDGTGYAIQHFFAGPDGSNPPDNLVQLGDRLYGMTQSGGKYNHGTIFGIPCASPG